MAFARLCPIVATDTQHGNGTFFETWCRSPRALAGRLLGSLDPSRLTSDKWGRCAATRSVRSYLLSKVRAVGIAPMRRLVVRAPPASGGGSALDPCCGGEVVASFLLSVVCCPSGTL